MRKVFSVKGFTLIEMLVVIAILGILSVLSAAIVSSIIRSSNKTVIVNEIQQNGDFVIDRFEKDVKHSNTIEYDTSLSPPQIRLIGDSGTVVWTCDNTTNFVIRRNGADVTNSDPNTGVRVTDCSQIKLWGAPNTPQMIRLAFTLEQAANAPGRVEFQAKVPFRVIVGNRGF